MTSKNFGNHDFLAVFGITDGADTDFVLTPAHTAGDGDDLVQMVLHKSRCRFWRGVAVGQTGRLRCRVNRQVNRKADGCRLRREGFDVEGEYRGHGVIGLDKE